MDPEMERDLDKGKIVYEGSSQTLDLAGLKEVYEHSTRVRI